MESEIHIVQLINDLSPLSNHYFGIVFKLVKYHNGGWFTDKESEQVLGQQEILVSDLMSRMSKNKLTMKLSLQPPGEGTEGKKSKCIVVIR